MALSRNNPEEFDRAMEQIDEEDNLCRRCGGILPESKVDLCDKCLLEEVEQEHDCRNGEPEDVCRLCGEAQRRGLIRESQ